MKSTSAAGSRVLVTLRKKQRGMERLARRNRPNQDFVGCTGEKPRRSLTFYGERRKEF